VHKTTQVNHPFTNGQVERMNRTIKEMTIYKYYYENGVTLDKHLLAFLDAYNLGKRLKALKGYMPMEASLEYCRNCLNWSEDKIAHYTLRPYSVFFGWFVGVGLWFGCVGFVGL